MLRDSLISFSSHIISIIFIFFLLSDTPLFSIIGLPVIPLFILFFLALILGRNIQLTDLKSVSFCITLFFLTSLFSAIFNKTPKPVLFGSLSIIYFLSTFFLKRDEIVRIVKVISGLLLLTLCFGFIAILFGTAQVFKISVIKNLDLYPLGLLYHNIPIPRLAGFFYEPGQLSFYICVCIVLRELLSLDSKLTFILLVLGFLTQSISHLFFSVFFLLFIFFKNSSSNNKLKFVLGFFAFFYLVSISGFFDWVFDRISTFISQPDEWSRFLSFNNALTVLDDDLNKYLVGPNSELSARVIEDENVFDIELDNVSVYGENPLSPLIFGGILASWPYYFFIIFYLFDSFTSGKKSFLVFIIALLTLQRPYTLEFPYALIISLLIVVNEVDSNSEKLILNDQ